MGQRRSKKEMMAKRARLHRHLVNQEWRCFYCGMPIAFRRSSPIHSTIDHKTPHSRGGEDTDDNTCACCWECNNRKGCMTEKEFRDSRSKDKKRGLLDAT